MSTDLIRDERSHIMTKTDFSCDTCDRECTSWTAGGHGCTDHSSLDDDEHNVLPDLTDGGEQDKALDLLITLQSDVGLGNARILAAIHNLLYDQWSELTPGRGDERMLVPGDNGIGSTF